MKSTKIEFIKEVIKQGNSYCVRIPKIGMEFLGLELGDLVHLTIKKYEKPTIPRKLLAIYKDTIKELKHFTYKELKECFFFFNIENECSKSLKLSEKRHLRKAFEKLIQFQRNKSFLKKYRLFKKIVSNYNSEKLIKALEKTAYHELATAIKLQAKAKTKNKS